MNTGRQALVRAEWQPALFGSPNRAQLLDCVPGWTCQPLRLRVHGNHGFAAVASALPAYAAWNGLAIVVAAGGYDDSLSFELEGEADIELVWLDAARHIGLDVRELPSWLVSRLRALRGATANAILCLVLPPSDHTTMAIREAAIPGVHVGDLSPLASEIGSAWLDPRSARLAGTILSNRACLLVARALACRWLPACALPPIKAIALDLDDTLYAGVLGEDGPQGVELTAGHRLLQERLSELCSGGMYLVLVSRNVRADVEALFTARTDFPLRLDDFSSVQISWGEKSTAIATIAAELRIAPSAIVFVDDNPGQLAAVASVLPVVTVHARPDASETWSALSHVAGMFRWHHTSEDGLRASDLRAASYRQSLAAGCLVPAEYLRSLNVTIGYRINRRNELARIHDLLQKTNQFNLALRRLGEAELAWRVDQPNHRIVTFSLSDRLSDSGVIGVIVASRDGATLRVEELCVSCRALGRRLEDTLLTEGLRRVAEGWKLSTVTFSVQCGPLNAPARQWLADYLAVDAKEVTADLGVPFEVICRKPVEYAVAIETGE